MASLVVGVNSYVSLAEADDFFNNFIYNETWINATVDEKERSLITATAMLDNNFLWYGEKTDPNQPLAFPRTYPDDCTDPNEIPQEIKDATCLQAQYLMDFPVYGKTDKIKKTKLDVMEVEYFESQYDSADYIYEGMILSLKCLGKPYYNNSDAGIICATRN